MRGLLAEAGLLAQQAFRQQELAIQSGAASRRAFHRAVQLSQRLSTAAPLATYLYSDPDAFDILRYLLDLSPGDIDGLSSGGFPNIISQPDELADLMSQLHIWSTPPEPSLARPRVPVNASGSRSARASASYQDVDVTELSGGNEGDGEEEEEEEEEEVEAEAASPTPRRILQRLKRSAPSSSRRTSLQGSAKRAKR